MQAIRSRISDIPESNVRDARKERDEEYISIANNRICSSLPYYHASQGEKKFYDDAKYTRYTSRKGRHLIKENY